MVKWNLFSSLFIIEFESNFPDLFISFRTICSMYFAFTLSLNERERESKSNSKSNSENKNEWVEIERRNYSILEYSANEWKHVLSHRTHIDRSANKEIETETNYEIINGPKLQTKSGDLLPEYYNMHVWMEDLFMTISFIYDAFVRFNIPMFFFSFTIDWLEKKIETNSNRKQLHSSRKEWECIW